ncbi:hypothetical protein TrCOL_g12921 [Triparma columacea]|uniref:CID domain-containing protein n=1 Tax=Triparma columacea TaxID=722753 RepID=A0A9W7L9T7_9STRA|nr:hypothetical protein TrCOL_g12921 [Triparma columacea]
MEDDDVTALTSQLSELGSHPDKAMINAITMLAEDYADDSVGANEFYAIIQARMVSDETSALFKLPLVYLVDSMLNNAKGEFITVVGETITTVFLSVYSKIDDQSKKKLARLLTIWKKNSMFPLNKIAIMEGIASPDAPTFNLDSLSKADLLDLRAMLHSMGEDVSLEELVEKNPEFVKQLFDNLAVFREERDKAEVAQEMTFWERDEVRDVNLTEANAVMKKLEDLLLGQVRGGEGEGDPLLLAAAGTKKYLHTLVTSFKNKPHEELINSTNASANVVDPADFTSEALSHSNKNDNVIFTLYGALPFSSKVDGGRFNSQILLREHLNTVSKVDELTSTFNSFGWFWGENDWMNVTDDDANVEMEEKKEDDDADEEAGRKDTVEADEMRDKCMICGKKFVNVYDDDECVYFSQDCREVVIEEDNGMETEEVLVHASCCKKLGMEVGESLPRKQVYTE